MEIVLVVLLLAALVSAWRARPRKGKRLFRDTPQHYRQLYNRRGFLKLGAGVVASAALAYSGVDEAFDRWHSEDVRGESSDRASSVFHYLGERFWFGFWAAFAVMDSLLGSSALTRWGRRTFEALVVGLPMLWTTQRVLGAARPSDNTHGPDFMPFADDNSASGHAFISAVPLLVAARTAPNAPLKGAAFATAPLAGWSRLNDRKHYLGQVLLGLWIAWNAVDAVVTGTVVPQPVAVPNPSPEESAG